MGISILAKDRTFAIILSKVKLNAVVSASGTWIEMVFLFMALHLEDINRGTCQNHSGKC